MKENLKLSYMIKTDGEEAVYGTTVEILSAFVNIQTEENSMEITVREDQLGKKMISANMRSLGDNTRLIFDVEIDEFVQVLRESGIGKIFGPNK